MDAPENVDFVMFVAPNGFPSGGMGSEEDYGKIRDFFTRSKEEVGAEWDKIVQQMQDLLQHVSVKIESFQLHEVEFELGFSAEGHLGFIAKAGANASVRVTFQRKKEDPAEG